MPVVTRLPKPDAGAGLISEPSLLFEGMEEWPEFGGCAEAFQQEMEVVGHYAISVDSEIVGCSGGEQIVDYRERRRMIGEYRAAFVGADGDEVGLFAAIGGGRETDWFTVEHLVWGVT